MLPVLAALVLAAPSGIVRDAYGVPTISAPSAGEAFYAAGYAVAQDRLWQMETSRRLARGRMAEVFGSAYVASDKDILQSGYTDEELQAQLDKLSPQLRMAFAEYARGVNAWIDEAKANGLPEGYAKAGFSPEPWTALDSAAIAIRLLQQFGRGGAGEIRNMALMAYLGTQPKLKGKELDVLDDFAWFNDPEATPTIPKGDDPVKDRPAFYLPDRKTTASHVAGLPKVSLFELMQGVRISEHEDSRQVAEQIAAPFQTGSYCVVVSAKKSATGRPLLLSGPQMGFRTPSIIHEMAFNAPGLSVTGMDVPGVPGVLIGHTPKIAWGLTSGVADTDDIFYYPADGADGYKYGGVHRDYTKIVRTLHVKGAPDQKITQLRTVDGPVVLNSASSKTLFAKRSSYWMRELESMESLAGVWTSSRADEAQQAIGRATMSFNFFCADDSNIAYRYAGLVPFRAEGVDPRFPTPGDPKFAWKGFVPVAQMPHAMNPKQGFFANWNNKPVSWFPNFDTPAWGKIFRNTEVLNTLDKPKLNVQDLEMTAWTIARRDETWPYFKPFVRQSDGARHIQMRTGDGPSPYPRAGTLASFDGRLLDGSIPAATYERFIERLRADLFLDTTGNFLVPDYFRLVAQPSVMLRALEGKTRVSYLHGRKAVDVVAKALAEAETPLDAPEVRYAANGIPVPGQPPIPYSDRGSFIQIVEFGRFNFTGRSISLPGIAETGPHALDQVPLARAWQYKPMSEPWNSK